MDDCGFRSPHFSEELAYLPPWLQPHQLPKVVTGVKDTTTTLMQPFQNIYYEDICLEQNGQQSLSNDAGFNSCHLYLSEDTNSLHKSIPLTGNALHLSLHLSCTSSQDKNSPVTSKHATSRSTSVTPTPQVQETQTEKQKGCRKGIKTNTPTPTLSQADIEEAIELSIAASEAMAITEVVSLDSDTYHFTVSNALEAALQVKKARRQMFEIGPGTSFQQNDDEPGSLSDLDERTMAAAYADAGFSDKGDPVSSSHIRSLDNHSDSTLVPCSIKESMSTPQIFGSRNPRPKEENGAAIQSHKGSHNFVGTEKNIKELQDNLVKDQEATIQGKTCRIIIKEPFIRESSFISESMDTMGILPFAPVEELGNEIVASNTPTNARNQCLNEGFLSSPDVFCSVVPCSLSNPCMDQASNERQNTVDLHQNLSRPQNAQNGHGVITRIMSTLDKYSVGIRDVRFNKAPQTFDKKDMDNSDVLLDVISEHTNFRNNSDLKRRDVVATVGNKNKRVRFLEPECVDKDAKMNEKMEQNKGHASSKSRTGVKYGLDCNSRIGKKKCSSSAGNRTERKEMMFQGLDFVLTGISRKKLRELQALIRRYAGHVLTKLPECTSDLRGKLVESTHWRPPVVICPKRVATTKFLYACAIDSWVLNPQWLIDSVQASHLLPPFEYLIRQLRASAWSYMDRDIFCFRRRTYIFQGMSFLLYGKVGFSSKYSNIIKHGGGQVFRSLQSLVHCLTAKSTETGVILVENEATSSRHLKFCALEHNIHTLPVSWIIETLYAGKLAPFKRDKHRPFQRIKAPKFKAKVEVFDMSQEI